MNKTLSYELICDNCKHPLSIPPVTLSEAGTFCGRCPNENSINLTIFECLAEKNFFPCRYRSNGCKQTEKFGIIKIHEENCKRQVIVCPVFSCPDKQLTLQEMMRHWQQFHLDLICLSDSDEFVVNLREMTKIVKLYIREQRTAVVIMQKVGGDVGVRCVYLEANSRKVEGTCLVAVSSLDKTQKFQMKIALEPLQTHPKYWYIDRRTLNHCSFNSVGGPVSVRIQFHINCNNPRIDSLLSLSQDNLSIPTSIFHVNPSDDHLLVCPVKPTEDCNFVGDKHQVSYHFKVKHSSNSCRSLDLSRIKVDLNQSETVFFLTVFEQEFKNIVRIQNGLCWMVMVIGPQDGRGFNFCLRFSRRDKQMEFWHTVKSFNNIEEFNKDYLVLGFDVLQGFIDNSCVICALEITRNNLE